MQLTYKALRRRRTSSFVNAMDENFFRKHDQEDHLVWATRIDNAYVQYCIDWEVYDNEPTRVCALFLKEVESYNRCTFGVENENFWMLEIEGVNWLGTYNI